MGSVGSCHCNMEFYAGVMTEKLIIIGFGGCGSNVVRHIQKLNNKPFVYRTLNITKHGAVNEENETRAWKQFFDLNIASYDLEYDELVLDPINLPGKITNYWEDWTSDLPIALVSGLGGTTGGGSILRFTQNLDILIRRRKLTAISAFVILPFLFEGKKRERLAFEKTSELKNLLGSSLYTFSNQKTFEIAGPKTTFTEAFAHADDTIYGLICDRFGIDKVDKIEPVSYEKEGPRADGLKYTTEASSEVGVSVTTMRFWEAEFGVPKPQKQGIKRFYSENDIKILKAFKTLLHEKSFQIPKLKSLIELRGIEYVVNLSSEQIGFVTIEEVARTTGLHPSKIGFYEGVIDKIEGIKY